MYYPLGFGAGLVYYIWMVQPKQPPLSIRPGDVRLAKIDAYALKHGLNRHAAMLELMDVGLDGRVSVAVQRPTPKPVPGSETAKRKAALGRAPARAVEAANRSIKEAVANPPRVTVPLYQPKAFNPQPKKGKGK